MRYSGENIAGLLKELCRLPNETEWVEFKTNKAEGELIGQYISALANSAALVGKAKGYMVWGVEDGTHRPVGTEFVPAKAKGEGNEDLESWLLRLLDPKIEIRFLETEAEGRRIVILEIEKASRQPVGFKGTEYIRIGSYKKKLKGFPDKQRQLWRHFDSLAFEEDLAARNVSQADVLHLLDHSSYFERMAVPDPSSLDGVMEKLSSERLIARSETGEWNITNLGAILFARKLADFPLLGRKAVRVIAYKGNSRVSTLRETEVPGGYAIGFEAAVEHIRNAVPEKEVIGKAFRKSVSMYPDLAIRELVANAIIHQDFGVRGAGPMVEIFEDRMEITNPGIPLVDVWRFLDIPPRSRNEALASVMRRIGVCEERGSGVDKVVTETETHQLPAPDFTVTGESTRATLYSHRPMDKMDKEERIRACYLHTCLKRVNNDFMTNTTLRERFDIPSGNSAIASRIIKETIAAGRIKPYDDTASRKYMKYVPFWG